MHDKAAAIAPPPARLGLAVAAPEGLDTDRFGTFTGAVPRAGNMVESARAKAELRPVFWTPGKANVACSSNSTGLR